MGCTQSGTKELTTNSPKNIETEDALNKILPSGMRINPADYRISNFIAAGGAGLVYSAVHHRNNTKIAMKFFGYAEKPINLSDVYHEIELFAAVSSLKNVVQLKGVFIDSPAGYINNKISKECYPVICMELMEGGDLFDRLQARNTVSEKFVARVFHEILIALESLHQIGYLHCDLKLENVMFSSLEDDSEVKLIDFGMMVHLPPEGIFICESIHGTAGYVAPESIKNCQYSPKSDIWQAGCILYSLLSGFQAFHPHYPELIVQGKYMKMTGIGWDNISNEAKDLVAQIFTKEPEKRPSISDILQHEWLRGSAPDTHMGEQYKQRIKQRALKQRMKNVVFNDDITNNKETKEKLKRILPLVKPRQKQRRTRSSIIRGSTKPPAPTPSSSSSSPSTAISIKGERLHASKSQKSHSENTQTTADRKSYRPVVSLDDIDLIRRKRDRTQSVDDSDFESKANDDFDVKISSLTSAFVQQTVEVARNKTNESLNHSQTEVTTPEIDLNTFVTVLRDCGLPELATPQMFYIFDPKKTGKIDLKEFLITMVVFRDTNHNVSNDINDLDETNDYYNSPKETNTSNSLTTTNEEDEDKLIRFYFNMFDFDNTGKIALDEMKIVIRCIFADKSNGSEGNEDQPTSYDIERMFEVLLNRSDIKSNETINFNEFKLFYNNLIKE